MFNYFSLVIYTMGEVSTELAFCIIVGIKLVFDAIKLHQKTSDKERRWYVARDGAALLLAMAAVYLSETKHDWAQLVFVLALAAFAFVMQLRDMFA